MPWKAPQILLHERSMEAVLGYNGLLEYIKKDVAKPQASDAHNLSQWKKDVVKMRRITLEGVWDHIISNLHRKETLFKMWKELTQLFENSSDHKKLALKDKLQSIKMQKNNIILKYLRKFTQCHDELGKVGVNVPKENLVALALLGLPKSWHNYQDSVNGKEKLLIWEHLWSNLVQEEIRQNTKDETSSKGGDEEKCTFDGKTKKGKGKKSKSKPESSQGGKKKGFSKIKCFHCHEFGHYATKFPQKKTSKKTSGGSVGEALAS